MRADKNTGKKHMEHEKDVVFSFTSFVACIFFSVCCLIIKKLPRTTQTIQKKEERHCWVICFWGKGVRVELTGT